MSGKRSSTSIALATTAPSEGEVMPAPVAPSVVDEVYNEIRAMQRDATVDLAIRMGELIVQKFYDGKLDTWREHGQKETSLRKLAEKFEESESGLSATGIYRAVAIYEHEQRLGVSARKHLTATHIRAVIGLPEDKQKKLLDDAEEKKWSTRVLEEKAAGVRVKASDGRGRPALPAFVKTANMLGKLADKDDAFDLEELDGMDDDAIESTVKKVSSMRERLVELEEKLEGKLEANRLARKKGTDN